MTISASRPTWLARRDRADRRPALRSEQAGGELLAVAGGAGVVGTHQLEDVDELLAGLVVVLHPVEQRVELGVVVVVDAGVVPPCGPRAATRRVSAVSGMRASSAERLVGRRRASTSSSASATIASSLPGSSSSAARSDVLVAGGDQRAQRRSSLGGQQRGRRTARTACSGWAPMKPSTTLPSLSAYTAGMRLHLEGLGDLRVLVDVDLDQLDLAVGRVDDLLDDRPERAARPAPRRPQVDDDGHARRSARGPRSRRWRR